VLIFVLFTRAQRGREVHTYGGASVKPQHRDEISGHQRVVILMYEYFNDDDDDDDDDDEVAFKASQFRSNVLHANCCVLICVSPASASSTKRGTKQQASGNTQKLRLAL